MDTSFLSMLLSASVLPLLAVLAVFLRRELFKGKLKILFLTVGLLLVSYAVFETFKNHGDELSLYDAVVAVVVAAGTFFILSKFSHTHKHRNEVGAAKGIVIGEASHSLIDGAVIGATFLVNPLLGTAATIGIVSHELPKILGTLAIFRGLGLSIKQTILYGICAQIGAPIAATLVFLLGAKISHDQFHLLEIASVASLGAIVVWIIYLELKFHSKDNHNPHEEGSGHAH